MVWFVYDYDYEEPIPTWRYRASVELAFTPTLCSFQEDRKTCCNLYVIFNVRHQLYWSTKCEIYVYVNVPLPEAEKKYLHSDI